MKNFEEISEQWMSQKPQTAVSLNSIYKKVAHVKNKNIIAIAVLVLTAMVLIGYFSYYMFYASAVFNLGLLLMISSVSIRIALEVVSIIRLDRVPEHTNVKAYYERLKKYYKARIAVHKIWTPILLVGYWAGFVLLIPTFKENLSSFWYYYVTYSSIPIALIMILFIRYHIRKEQRVLEKVVEDLKSL
jgi:hypothetical protein